MVCPLSYVPRTTSLATPREISADRRDSLDLFQVPGCDEADTAFTTCVMLGGIMEA